MAQIDPQNIVVTKGRQKTINRWGPFGAGDICAPVYPNETEALGMIAHFSVAGVFGGPVTLQGSLDDVNWFDLPNGSGGVIGVIGGDVPKAFEISTAAPAIRPSPGAGAAGVTVTICMKG